MNLYILRSTSENDGRLRGRIVVQLAAMSSRSVHGWLKRACDVRGGYAKQLRREGLHSEWELKTRRREIALVY